MDIKKLMDIKSIEIRIDDKVKELRFKYDVITTGNKIISHDASINYNNDSKRLKVKL